MEVTEEHIINLASRMFNVNIDTIIRYQKMSKIDLGSITAVYPNTVSSVLSELFILC
jgi:hypothetical protein